MALKLEQIEKFWPDKFTVKAGRRKWLKNQRNRLIRRVDVTKEPNIKYYGWEY